MAILPKVSRCDITHCSFNHDRMCHASAITIGNGAHPRCETHFTRLEKGGDLGSIAKVGACKSTNCEYNRDLECYAPEIHVGIAGNNVHCLTFIERSLIKT